MCSKQTGNQMENENDKILPKIEKMDEQLQRNSNYLWTEVQDVVREWNEFKANKKKTMPDAQLTMDKLWEAKDDGSLTNKLKQYPLVSFNHTAHKIWKLPTDIKTMEKNTNLATHKIGRNFLPKPTRVEDKSVTISLEYVLDER